MDFDAVVLAGGSSRRLGGSDKARVEIAGRTLLARAVAALGEARWIVVVGPRRAEAGEVAWAREDPAGAGPVAAIAAGLEPVTASMVVIAAVDHPFLTSETVARLVAARAGADGAVVAAPGGRPEPLVGCYSTAALRAALARLGPPRGASVRALIAPLRLAVVEDAAAALDCDTWDDIAAAEELAGS